MPRKIDFTVPEEYEGVKAFRFMRGPCGISMRIMRVVKHTPNAMLRNGEPLRTIDFLHAGDTVSIIIPDDTESVEPLEAELDIVYEDDDILVINKSPFMAMHPTHNHQGDTLANAVAAYLASKGKSASFRAVGRLDKGTSGLVVCALNSFSASKLAGNVKKEYFALVKGELEGEGSIDVPIYRPDPMKTWRACSYELGVESALTHWKTEKRFVGATLVSLRLETGRTHQIRVHMAFEGHPLAGDNMYGDFMQEIGHQLLHCRRCFFEHPVTGEKMSFEGKYYEDFARTIADLTEKPY